MFWLWEVNEKVSSSKEKKTKIKTNNSPTFLIDLAKIEDSNGNTHYME